MAVEYKNVCQSCKVLEQCRAAFGRYWALRSNNGAGCSVAFPGWSFYLSTRIQQRLLKLGDKRK